MKSTKARKEYTYLAVSREVDKISLGGWGLWFFDWYVDPCICQWFIFGRYYSIWWPTYQLLKHLLSLPFSQKPDIFTLGTRGRGRAMACSIQPLNKFYHTIMHVLSYLCSMSLLCMFHRYYLHDLSYCTTMCVQSYQYMCSVLSPRVVSHPPPPPVCFRGYNPHAV